MINSIDNMVNEFTSEVNLAMGKISAIVEASERELAINYKQAELKVLNENGTDDDLSMLYEAAKESNTANLSKAFEALKDSISGTFAELSEKVSNQIDTTANKEVIQKLRDKVKLARLLKTQSVMIYNDAAIQAEVDKAIAKLNALGTKIKNGDATSAEIEAIKKEFSKKLAEVTNKASHVKTGVESACTECEKKMKNATNAVNRAKVDADKAISNAIKSINEKTDPALVKEWCNAYIEIITKGTNASLDGIKDIVSEIKAKIASYSKVQKDVANEMNESEEPESDVTEDDVVTESTDDGQVEVELNDNDTLDMSDTLSEPVSVDGYGAALSMPDPVSDDSLDSLEAECGTMEAYSESDPEYNEILESVKAEFGIYDPVSESVESENEFDALLEGSNLTVGELDAIFEQLDAEAEPEVTVESLYEELFGEPYNESSKENELQETFDAIFAEATAASNDAEIKNPTEDMVAESSNQVSLEEEENAGEPVKESVFESLLNTINSL